MGLGRSCVMSCDPGYVFPTEQAELNYRCGDGGHWNKGVLVPDCIGTYEDRMTKSLYRLSHNI